ncbi:DUF3817 domain-containing protein [Winogradskyella aurantia]|uniref:DUF3817 domain-containing protein n=1 Tax=Winogradskyella aurantia TaxID=1915063 RepID=UPI0026BECD1E
MLKLLSIFRITAFLEGISYILLLFLAVPIKYVWEDPQYVKLLGMPHGLLFIIYIVIAFWIKDDMEWSSKDFALVLLASIIPFGTFYVDKHYLTNSNG